MTQLLPDIERGETWTANHLRRCLCRWIMRQPQAVRQGFYELWAKRRGKASAQQLAKDVRAEWQQTCAEQA